MIRGFLIIFPHINLICLFLVSSTTAWLFGMKFSIPNLTLIALNCPLKWCWKDVYCQNLWLKNDHICIYKFMKKKNIYSMHSSVWETTLIIQSSIHTLHPCTLFKYKYVFPMAINYWTERLWSCHFLNDFVFFVIKWIKNGLALLLQCSDRRHLLYLWSPQCTGIHS